MKIGKTAAWCLACGCGLAMVLGAAAADKKEPGKLELGGARKRLEDFEAKVKRMRGQPFKLGYVESEALRRIAALQDKYPDSTEVKELFDRARKALMASKGEIKEVAKDVLRYRENEKKLQGMFLDVARKEWADFRDSLEKSGRLLPKAFPPPSQRDTSLDKLEGKFVVLEDFEYPTNEFTDMGRQFCFVGSGARGYYYVELSNREWLGAYEAVKRYRRMVNQDVPEGMKWTLVGQIIGLELVVPRAGKKKIGPAHWGWTVRPVAIWVPDRTFAVAAPALELGGSFAGEDRLEGIKSTMYSVTSIPDDVTPERLTEIYVTAIKEKNYPLYLECIDPRRRQTPKGRSLCMYHWEWHQKRFATFYCDVKVGKATIQVVQGFDEGPGGIETRFLTAEDRAKIKAHSAPLVEHAELSTKAFDERGKQYGSPKPRYFRRVEKKRWYITNYPQPF